MPVKFVSRSRGIPQATRATARFGQVFSYLDKSGNIKKEMFLTLGGSDRLYSFKTSNNELSSAALGKGVAPIAVVGSFSVRTELFKDRKDYHKDFRAQLRVGDTYRVTKTGPLYTHLGELTDGRYFAINLDNKEIATTSTKDKEVSVVGLSTFEVRVV